jgi:D-3-phosphoglycerate dehydrogenase
MNPKVLIADDVSEDCDQILQHNGIEVTRMSKIPEEKLPEVIGDFSGVIVRSRIKIKQPAIEAGKNLKVIGRAGIGVDNIDVDFATKKGVIVMNAPDANTIAAAEHTFGLMLAATRNITQGDSQIRAGKWERKALMGFELNGKTLGIVGIGRVGKKVAQYAIAFGMNVIAYDPYVSQVEGVKMVDFQTLLKTADIITIHVTLTPETKNMFSEKQFAMMKKNAILINTSRGGVIDENALIKALEQKQIKAAGLDVYQTEPPPKDSPLLKLPNVVLTPHLGASAKEAQIKAGTMVAHQFVKYFKHGEIINAVNAP